MRPPLYYPLIVSKKPANVVVRLPSGFGHDPALLANALKRLRSQMGDVSRAMRMHERYVPPGERRRLKSARARARVRRGALRFARWEVRQEARGLCPRPCSCGAVLVRVVAFG